MKAKNVGLIGELNILVDELRGDLEIPPEEEMMDMAWDDITGEELCAEEVAKPRAEDIRYLRKLRVYDKAPISQRGSRTGKSPIRWRRVDISKRDRDRPNHRSPPVARNIKRSTRPNLAAPAPPRGVEDCIVHSDTGQERHQVDDS